VKKIKVIPEPSPYGCTLCGEFGCEHLTPTKLEQQMSSLEGQRDCAIAGFIYAPYVPLQLTAAKVSRWSQFFWWFLRKIGLKKRYYEWKYGESYDDW